ncbi:MAG: V-type ATP synthase subunit D [Nanoarchaeota archaeon]|nr:V-type ATP synthase subunit D [Nanoarchaeota archaeon]
MTNIKPTRSELIKLKRQIQLAKSGHKILKKKRDGLILEFFDILKEAKSVRGELNEYFKEAQEKMNICRMLEGDLHIKSIALAIKKKPKITVNERNIMGVVVPKIESEFSVQKDLFERGYGIITSSVALDEAAKAYEKVIDTVVLAAEVEITIKKLLEEIEKTKRRVNALEFELIPRMERVQRFITFRLEEIERETTFRTKLIKKKT